MHYVKSLLLLTLSLVYSLDSGLVGLQSVSADEMKAFNRNAFISQGSRATYYGQLVSQTDLAGPSNGVGQVESGWVSAEVNLNPQQSNSSGAAQAQEVSSNNQLNPSGNVIGSNSQLNGGVSVLDSTTRAAESDASANGLSGPSLNSPILSAPAAIGAINSGTTNTGLFQSINPFRSLNATAQTPANQALSGNRLFAWLRNFPLFSLNQSTISTEAPINAWQERLRSFYQAPSASLQDSALGAGERRGLFSALMPNSSASQTSDTQLDQGLASAESSQDSSTTAASTRPLLNNLLGVTQRFTQGNTSLTGTSSGNSLANPTQASGASISGYRGASDSQVQVFNSGAAEANATDAGIAQQGNSVAAQTPAYSAFQAPKENCWNQFWDRWFGTGYRTSSYRVPVTYYRPVVTTDPTTGQQIVVQQPCTSYVQQAQRTPFRLFRAARPNLGNQSPASFDPTACPPGALPAMPAVIYPGLGYVVAANPTAGALGTSYVIANSGLQQASLPMGVAVWNGAVVPASAVLVAPTSLPNQAALNNGVNGNATGAVQEMNASENRVGKPLTAADLSGVGNQSSKSGSSDLTPMPAPRLDSYRYAPASPSDAKDSDSTGTQKEESDGNGASDSDGKLGQWRSHQNPFSAPSSVVAPRRGTTNAQWRLQNAADSTAFLRSRSSAGASRFGSSAERNQNDSSQVEVRRSDSKTPSLEDLLRSENFVGAEPIAAPRDFQPSYPRARGSSVKLPSQVDGAFQEQLAQEPEARESGSVKDLRTISVTLPEGSGAEISTTSSDRFIRQPVSAR